MPGVFDPKTGLAVNPSSGKVDTFRFCPKTSLPIDPETGEVVKVQADGSASLPGLSGEQIQGQFDVKTGKRIDPKTSQTVCDFYCKSTGRPINPESGEVFPLDSEGRPHDPETGTVLAGCFDIESGRPLDPQTTEEIEHESFCPDTGRPIDPETQELLELNEEGYPETEEGEVIYMGPFDEKTGLKMDEEGNLSSMHRYDPDTGLPNDIAAQ